MLDAKGELLELLSVSTDDDDITKFRRRLTVRNHHR